MAFHDAAKDEDLDSAYCGHMPDTGAIAGKKQPAEPTGLDLLQAWIGRDSAWRCVERMARKNGTVIIELRSRSGVHESTTQTDLDSGIRTALMTAEWSGEK